MPRRTLFFMLALALLAASQPVRPQRTTSFDGFQLLVEGGDALVDGYPDNKLWGDGWGWALFKADAPDKQVATDYKKDCLGCHVPAKSTDWTYIQGYPVLKSE